MQTSRHPVSELNNSLSSSWKAGKITGNMRTHRLGGQGEQQNNTSQERKVLGSRSGTSPEVPKQGGENRRQKGPSTCLQATSGVFRCASRPFQIPSLDFESPKASSLNSPSPHRSWLFCKIPRSLKPSSCPPRPLSQPLLLGVPARFSSPRNPVSARRALPR